MGWRAPVRARDQVGKAAVWHAVERRWRSDGHALGRGWCIGLGKVCVGVGCEGLRGVPVSLGNVLHAEPEQDGRHMSSGADGGKQCGGESTCARWQSMQYARMVRGAWPWRRLSVKGAGNFPRPLAFCSESYVGAVAETLAARAGKEGVHREALDATLGPLASQARESPTFRALSRILVPWPWR